MFLFSGLADRSPLTVGYPKLASTPPPCLPSLVGEGEVPFCPGCLGRLAGMNGEKNSRGSKKREL